MGHEGGIAIPAELALLNTGRAVGDGRWGDLHGELNGRLQKRGMKAQDLDSVGTGAFGKQQNRNSGFEHGSHLAGSLFSAGAAPPVEEDRSSCAGEEAEDGPAAYFLFGDEDTRGSRGIDQNVEVAEVVGTDQALAGALAAELQANFETAEDESAGSVQPLSPMPKLEAGSVSKANNQETNRNFDQGSEQDQ